MSWSESTKKGKSIESNCFRQFFIPDSSTIAVAAAVEEEEEEARFNKMAALRSMRFRRP
jgi:hypothetical protein